MQHTGETPNWASIVLNVPPINAVLQQDLLISFPLTNDPFCPTAYHEFWISLTCDMQYRGGLLPKYGISIFDHVLPESSVLKIVPSSPQANVTY